MWRCPRKLALVTIALSACRGTPIAPRPAELRVVTAARSATRSASTAFHAQLRAENEPPAANAGGAGLEARLSLRLRSDAFEYHVKLQHPGTVQVTEALVASRRDSGGTLTPVLVLFRDARFSDRFVDVRGFGTVLPSMSASAIADEIQGRPSAFVVLLLGPAGQRWVAPLLEGR